MVSADELQPAAKGLKLETRLNGKFMRSDKTANMMFPVVEMLVYLTQGLTLERHHLHRHAVRCRRRPQARPDLDAQRRRV